MAIVTYTRLRVHVEQSVSSDYSTPLLSELLTAALGATLRAANRVDFDLTNVAQDIPTAKADVGNTLVLVNDDATATVTASLRPHGGGSNLSFIIQANGIAIFPGLALASCTLVSSAATSKAHGYILTVTDSAT